MIAKVWPKIFYFSYTQFTLIFNVILIYSLFPVEWKVETYAAVQFSRWF